MFIDPRQRQGQQDFQGRRVNTQGAGMAGSWVWFGGDSEERGFAVPGAREVAGKGALGFGGEIWAVDPEPGPLLSEHRQRGRCSPSPQTQMAPPIPASCWRTPPRGCAGRPTWSSPTTTTWGTSPGTRLPSPCPARRSSAPWCWPGSPTA